MNPFYIGDYFIFFIFTSCNTLQYNQGEGKKVKISESSNVVFIYSQEA